MTQLICKSRRTSYWAKLLSLICTLINVRISHKEGYCYDYWYRVVYFLITQSTGHCDTLICQRIETNLDYLQEELYNKSHWWESFQIVDTLFGHLSIREYHIALVRPFGFIYVYTSDASLFQSPMWMSCFSWYINSVILVLRCFDVFIGTCESTHKLFESTLSLCKSTFSMC